MKRREFTLAAAAAALPGLMSLPAHAQSGKGYIELSPRAPVDAPAGQIEVVEFFSYGCPHCMHFEPIMDAWVKTLPKDVAFRRVHVGFQSNFAPLQKSSTRWRPWARSTPPCRTRCSRPCRPIAST
ncbi:hypothetical protein ACFSTJ_08095 [Ottowia pentelensis]|uniref:hypothetical protein n=1 Tax=Ottowia pentelensis TaxID=511108 RepID=UPI0036453BAE